MGNFLSTIGNLIPGNFITGIIDFKNKMKDTAELVGPDMFTWIVPAVMSLLFGLKDLIDFEAYQIILNLASAGAYSWLAYRFCQMITKKRGTTLNKKDAILHSIIKGVIVGLCAMIGYFIITLIPFVNLLEYVSVLGPALLYFFIISPMYLIVTILYPLKC
jgi:hypothetical protein